MSAPSIPDSILRLPARTAEFGALLARWCAINSGSGHGAGLERMRLALAEAFAHAFPAAEIQTLASDAPGRNPEGVKSLRIRLRPEAPRQVLLSGHYDTVFEADDPFQSCRWTDPDTLNAPGAADMKGGILTILAALEAFEAAPGAAGLGWEVLLTPDEETGSHGTRALFLEARQRYDFGFVFEPARPNGDLVHSRKGTGVFVAVCHGRAAHAAKIPNDGRNAILALAEFLLARGMAAGELGRNAQRLSDLREASRVAIAAGAWAAEAADGPGTLLWLRDFADGKLGMYVMNVAGAKTEVVEADGRKLVSYGTSSYGYDIRCSSEFKLFTNLNSTIVDPKNFDPNSFVEVDADYCIIPPNSFALARTVEYFRVPEDVLVICLGKSTYARCGIIVNVTPLEPGWEGHVTLEFSNTTPLPAKIYANEGACQFLFLQGNERCETSYKDRAGKYMGQRGVTLPRL
jgi:deoxycytidine triphosphate deaminase